MTLTKLHPYAPAYPCFISSIPHTATYPALSSPQSGPYAEDVSSKRSNRKRTRHRPRSRGRGRGNPSLSSSSTGCPEPSAMSVRYSYTSPNPPATLSVPASTCGQDWRTGREDLRARERRIFGGGFDDDCHAGYGVCGREDDVMRRGMLDVVLGLFDGLDYEDEDFGFISGKV